jgi:hypothetical protein
VERGGYLDAKCIQYEQKQQDKEEQNSSLNTFRRLPILGFTSRGGNQGSK